MSRLIEGLESIKVLFDTKAKQSENAGYWKDFAGIIADAISTITEKTQRIENMETMIEDMEERIAIMSEGGWHKATELPKETDDYIVTIIEMERWKSVTTRNYRISFGWGLFSNEKLVCWMPFPKPPKEGEA